MTKTLEKLGAAADAGALARWSRRLVAALKHQLRPAPERRPTPQAVYLGDHRALLRTIFGHKMYVDTRDVSLAPHLLIDGLWERWITERVRDLLRPGMTVVDVGANVGYYSVLAADAVGPSGRVHAFEPNPDLVEILYTNLAINGFGDRATVVAKAVHARQGSVALHRFRRHMGSSSLWASEAHAQAHHDSLDSVTVESVPLDVHFAPGTRVDFVKIDAEGAEPLVLQGARRMLTENRDVKVVLEFAPAMLAASSSAQDVYDLLRALGFRVCRIAEGGALVPVTLSDLLPRPHSDLLLTRD
jgi:FkbM family methyltransferase